MEKNRFEQKNKQVSVQKNDEKILVVRKEAIFPDGVFSGFISTKLDSYQEIISKNQEFIWRQDAEIDTKFKQIIPYMIFKYSDLYFLMQRSANASETRLASKYSLGIGGHVREEDFSTNSIFDWAQREFHEEVSFSGNLKITPLGLLNDESNLVGQVHTGLVLLLEGDSDQISIKSELKSGILLNLEECEKFYERMESWSQIIFRFLKPSSFAC